MNGDRRGERGRERERVGREREEREGDSSDKVTRNASRRLLHTATEMEPLGHIFQAICYQHCSYMLYL